MSTATIQPEAVDIPEDTTPPTSPPPPALGDYNPEYPGSTEDHPYGFKPDGSAYTRKPRNGPEPTRLPAGWAKSSSSSKTSRGSMPASESQARAAAALLTTANSLIGNSLAAFGLTVTGDLMADANESFEAAAYQALLADPALCRKILSGGALSGKLMLAMAYGNMAMQVGPSAYAELTLKKAGNG